VNASDLIDLRQFGPELRKRRNKGAILLTSGLDGQKEYAARLAETLGARHIDALDAFRSSPGLSSGLDAFSLEDFFEEIIRPGGGPGDLLVVGGIEFLLGAWLAQGEPKKVKLDLCRRTELWEGPPAFILVTVHDPVLAGYAPERHKGGPVVIDASRTLALPS